MIYFLKVNCINSSYNNVEIYYSKFSAFLRYKHLKSYIDNQIGMIESIFLIDCNGVVVARLWGELIMWENLLWSVATELATPLTMFLYIILILDWCRSLLFYNK